MLNIESTLTALGAAHVAAELDLLAVVYCDPRGMAPVATAAGLRPIHFGQTDLRILWLAAELASPRFGLPGVFRLARRALSDAGLWCDRGPIYLGPPWSDESLNLLAGSYFPSPTIVRQRAARLIKLNLLGREALAVLRRVASAVEGSAALQPPAAPVVRNVTAGRPLVVNAPGLQLERGAAA